MNSLNELILFVIIGRLMVYLWMQFHLPKWLDNEFMRGLHDCDLCSGVWIYPALFILFRVDLLHLMGLPYVRVVSEFMSGGIISFIVHIFIIGWKSKFEVVILE